MRSNYDGDYTLDPFGRKYGSKDSMHNDGFLPALMHGGGFPVDQQQTLPPLGPSPMEHHDPYMSRPLAKPSLGLPPPVMEEQPNPYMSRSPMGYMGTKPIDGPGYLNMLSQIRRRRQFR